MTKKRAVRAVIIGCTTTIHAVQASVVFAEPAVFFNADIDAGRERFVDVINSTVTAGETVEIFELNLFSATSSGGLYAVTGSEGSTTYVRFSLPASGGVLDETRFTGAGAIYGYSVSLSNTGLAAWDEAVSEGLQVEFFEDASATTSISMNALGLEVEDWGTCCFTSGVDGFGNESQPTSVYAVFDPQLAPQGSDPTINLIGSITSSADRGTFAGTLADGISTNNTGGIDNHFVAAINDTNSFSTIAIVPTGRGEYFGFGGIVYFSRVAEGSVPPGSSEVVIGSRTDIVDPSSSQADLGDSLNFAFDGGELLVSSDSTADFELKSGGGTMNTQGNDVVFSGDFTGPGEMVKSGAGRLVLTGANTYMGGTVVSAGTLSTAGGGTLADGGDVLIASDAQFIAGTADTVGSVTNAGTLRTDAALTVASLDTTGTTTVNAVLSSAGAIANRTGSTLLMNADVSSLGMFLADGSATVTGSNTLAVGGLAGTGTFAISSGSTLDLDLGSNSVFAGSISSLDGDFIKRGANTLALTGANSSRVATVAEGALQLLGSFTAPRFNINAGTTLFGSGRIDGDLYIDGQLAPGNSPGTIIVNGDVVFGAGGLFSVEIDGNVYNPAGGPGTYDRLVVTGVDSVVSAGGTIAPMLRGMTGANNDFTPTVGDVFRVIEVTENPNGISGTFDTLVATPDGIAPGTRFSVVYGDDYVDLAIIPNDFGAFARAYEYENMTRAGASFETIFSSQVSASDFLNGLNGLTGDQLAFALLQASGEIHAFSLAGFKQASRSLSGAALGRIASFPEGQRVWTDLSGYRADFDDDAIASMYKSDHHHMWVGVDFIQTATQRGGAALGYAGGSIDAAYSGEAAYESVNAAFYYHRAFGNLKLSSIAGIGFADINTERSTSLSTGVATNTSDSSATIAFAETKLSYNQVIGDAVEGSLWSSVRLDAVRAKAFVEDGSDLTSLTVGRENDQSATVSAGYDLVGNMMLGSVESRWKVGLGAIHTPERDRFTSRDLSMHDADWQVSSPETSNLSGYVSAGLHMSLSSNSTFDISVKAAGAKGWEAYGASVSFSTRW